VHFDGLFFRTSFPAGSGYRTSPESHIFFDLSVHASDLLSSSDHRYFDVICLYSSDDPRDLADDYILYFQYAIVFPCLSRIIHVIEQLMFFTSACILICYLNHKCTCNNQHAHAITHMHMQ
jgi:hypothetical protein